MKNRTICFIGQIDIGENSSKIKMLLTKNLMKFILNGYKCICVDDRLGFDELSFDTVVKIKKLYVDLSPIKIILYEDTKGTVVKRDKEQYENFCELSKEADFHNSFYGRTRTKSANKKHIPMIERSSICVTYFNANADEETLRSLEFAKQKGLKIINIYDEMNNDELLVDPCKYELYFYEYDFFEEKEKVVPKWDSNQAEIFNELGLNKFVKDRSYTPKKVIEKDKITFFRLKDKLSLYARQHKGSIRAVVNTEKWEARIDVTLPYFRCVTVEEHNLIKDITQNTKCFSMLPLKDGGVLWSIIIPYFENIEQ